MSRPARAEVWIADLGYNAKTRPVVVFSVPFDDQERALFTVVYHTTSLRGTRFEVPIQARFLHAGAFDAQQMISIPQARFERKIGTLNSAQMQEVEAAVRQWPAL